MWQAAQLEAEQPVASDDGAGRAATLYWVTQAVTMSARPCVTTPTIIISDASSICIHCPGVLG